MVRLIPRERFDEAYLIKPSRGRAGQVHPLLYGTALAFVWPALHGLPS